MNTEKLVIEIFGSSREQNIGVRVNGLPKGYKVDKDELYKFLCRRKPSHSAWSTERHEDDIPVFLSGIDGNGVLNGETLCAIIQNNGINTKEKTNRNRIPRPGHADYAAVCKYGESVDLRGGGRFSGRMTAPLCVAGGIILQILAKKGISVHSHIYSVKNIYDKPYCLSCNDIDKYRNTDDLPVLDETVAEKMIKCIEEAKANGDSVGGVAEIAVLGMPKGIGGELFDGIEGNISYRVFGIPAVKGIEFGNGFECTRINGSENNDCYAVENGEIVTVTNNCGGILGGISNGMPLIFRVAVKPTPSIGKTQNSVDIQTKENVKIRIEGKNDACIVPRVLPVIEAATAVALYEMI